MATTLPRTIGDDPAPRPTPEERAELSGIAYFLDQWDALHARGLVGDDAHRTIADEYNARRAALEREGRFRAAMESSQNVAASRPAEALAWAAAARRIDPGRVEGWLRSIELLERLGRRDEALALGDSADGRFPALADRLARLRTPAVDGDWRARLEDARRREADPETIEIALRHLEGHPDDVDALANLALAQRRLGRLDEASASYRRLMALRPDDPVWPTWVREIARLRGKPSRGRGHGRGRSAKAVPGSESTSTAKSPATAPGLSWSGVAGEFLQEHWQKLLLGMAVLLIVVSSTVGARVVLGPKLWSPSGKCALALFYTLLLAALGGGLRRWGADRAGRLVLATTLALVPVHFLLLGEMRLMAAPTRAGLAVLAVDVAALYALTRRVVAVLRLPGAGSLAVALIGMGALGAWTAPGMPASWGLASLWLLAALFLGSVWRLERRPGGDPGAADLALGLPAFAFAAGTLRTGAFVLGPTPALYALPTMVAALAAMLIARGRSRRGEDPQQVEMLRFGSIVLSGLAFALALSRPPGPSPLFSGNTLATALLGFALYAGSLARRRRPAYLYFAFGAVVVGFLGAHYFIALRIHLVEEMLRRALGYPSRLPAPFRALVGLPLNVALAATSIAFRRLWRDDRLARHCHHLGVPASIAACVFSTFEPKAALICLPCYALLYAIAARVFDAPRALYLACAATAVAAYFGWTLSPGATLAALALASVTLGLAFEAVATWLAGRGADRPYRIPLDRSAAALSVVAGVNSAFASLDDGAGTPATTAALALAAGLSAWLVGPIPAAALACWSATAALGAWLCGLDRLDPRALETPARLGLAAVAFAPAALVAAAWCRSRGGSPRASAFARTLPVFALVLVVVAELVAASPWAAGPEFAIALLLGAAATLGVTRFRRSEALVYAGLILGVASALVTGGWRFGGSEPGVLLGAQAAIAAATAVALVLAAAVGGRLGLSAFYAGPCRDVAFVAATSAGMLAVVARIDSRAAFPGGLAALLLVALAYAVLAAAWRRAALSYGMVLALVAALHLTLASLSHADPEEAYILGLAGVLLGLLFWAAAFACRRYLGAAWAAIYAVPLEVGTLGLAAFAFPTAYDSAATMLLTSVALLLLIRSFPTTAWIYPATAALAMAFYDAALRGQSGTTLMAAATAGAFALWGLGVLVRKIRPAACRRLGLSDLPYESPLFDTVTGMAALAAVLRAGLTVDAVVPWTAHAWLPIALGVFCLLMFTARPRAIWVHAGVGLISAGLLLSLVPSIATPLWWLPALLALALGWDAARRVVSDRSAWLDGRLGVDGAGAARSIVADASILFAVATAMTALEVASATAGAIIPDLGPTVAFDRHGWLAVLLALGLIAHGLLVLGLPLSNAGRIEGLLLLLVPAAWWLGVPGAPTGIAPATYLPVLTAAMSLGMVVLGLGIAREESAAWAVPRVGDEFAASRAARIDRFAWGLGFALTFVAAALTGGTVGRATLAALLLATSALALLTRECRRIGAAYSSGIFWGFSCLYAALESATARGIRDGPALSGDVALGGLAAVVGLWYASGWLRRSAPEVPRFLGPVARGPASRDRLGRALERVAVLIAIATGLAALVPVADGSPIPGTGGWACVAALLGVSAVSAGIAGRWGSRVLIYLSQAGLVGAYYASRPVVSPDGSADAGVLLGLGYLDLGIAEVVGGLGRDLYARPLRHVALVLPILSLLQRLDGGGYADNAGLFLLLTASAFYGLAGLRIRGAGYAGLVLANAFLWAAWSRLGWMLDDHPQFFLIPVGLSAILFAEVERDVLGRNRVEAIRGSGLVLMYLSLALPIWRFQSLGAWLTVLLVSLAGILAGIGLRARSFLWLGLAGFVVDVLYQLGRVSMNDPLARWGIMLTLGLLLVLFVALNEKRRIVVSLRSYLGEVRRWE